MATLDYRKDHVRQIDEMLGKLERMQRILEQLPPLNENTDGRKGELQEQLTTLDINMRQRLGRVKQETARVSVIGLEKQGKSTFVNAWIGKQCLPSDTKRCTWASSTLINDKEYRARVRFLTSVDFENTIDGLFKSLNLRRASIGFPFSPAVKEREDVAPLTGIPAFKDLEQLSQHHGEIRTHLDKSDVEIKSTSIEDFNSKLFAWVSLRGKDGVENGKAYAVAHCDIYLPIEKELLLSVDDLPGIDAPGNRAEEMTWRNVEQNADVIVLVKNAFNNASMNSNEIKIWDKARQSDSAVKLTDRLFVALNQADADKSENGRNCHLEAFNEFRGRNVPENRIFYVSSRAELYGSAQDKTKLSFDDWSEEKQEKSTISIAEKRKQGKPTTGFPEFKEAMYRFLENDFQSLEERALRNLKEGFDDHRDRFKKLLEQYQNANRSENNATEEARERFGELWLPQGKAQINRDGLGNKIKVKIGLLLNELNINPEKTIDFLEGIRAEIEKSRESLLKENTIGKFEQEYNPVASPIKNYGEMRETYFTRIHGTAKGEIFNNLSAAISQNINSHIKGIWGEAIAESDENAPRGLGAIDSDSINEFLRMKKPEALFSTLDNNEVGKVPYGFAALLKSIAHADLEYLISTNSKLTDQRAKILYKAKLYEEGIISSNVGSQLKRIYNDEVNQKQTPANALAKVAEKLKENSGLLKSAVDVLLPKPYAELAGFILNVIDKKDKNRGGATKGGPAAAVPVAKGNPFGSKNADVGANKNFILIDNKEDIKPEDVVAEMEQRIKLVYYVLEAMLFDDDFGIVGYYRAIMEEFRLLVLDEIQNDGGVIKSLAFNNREIVFPNEPLFKRDNKKEQLLRLLSEAATLGQ